MDSLCKDGIQFNKINLKSSLSKYSLCTDEVQLVINQDNQVYLAHSLSADENLYFNFFY